MKLLYLVTLISVSSALTLPVFGEPTSLSCESALEKVDKARNALIPFRRTVELARARERGAYGELTVCAGGGIFSANKALRCSEWQWQAPQRTKDVIEAEDQYIQGRKEFEELFYQAGQTCLSDPG